MRDLIELIDLLLMAVFVWILRTVIEIWLAIRIPLGILFVVLPWYIAMTRKDYSTCAEILCGTLFVMGVFILLPALFSVLDRKRES